MYRALGVVCLLLLVFQTNALSAEVDPAPVPSGRLIVFVNGINSDIEGTFRNPTNGAFWPSLMRNDDDNVFERADILVYPIVTDFGDDSPRITDIADKLATDVNDTLKPYTSVLFVAHSLGGVVLRRYLLVESRKEGGGITSDNRIKGLLLLGTPTNGAAIANLGSEIFASKTLWQLGESNDPDSFLDTLRDEWIDEGMVPRIATECGYETVGVPVKFLWWEVGPGVTVVTPDSASTLCTTGVTGLVQLDHFGIAKPATADAQPYRLAVQWYQELFDDPAEETKSGDVVIANCEVDRYGASLFDKFAKSLYDKSISMRVSPRLPQDWSDDTPNSSIWTGSQPGLLVIHYSCFQDMDGVDDDVLEERRVDFNELLASLANTDVKVLTYSRAFWDYPAFVQENITKANREAFNDGRLLLLPLRHGVGIGEEAIGQFEGLIDQALAD
jgi:pimeloyl-ACP methyl ester carboxylesterase